MISCMIPEKFRLIKGEKVMDGREDHPSYAAVHERHVRATKAHLSAGFDCLDELFASLEKKQTNEDTDDGVFRCTTSAWEVVFYKSYVEEDEGYILEIYSFEGPLSLMRNFQPGDVFKLEKDALHILDPEDKEFIRHPGAIEMVAEAVHAMAAQAQLDALQ